ncbi:hypothetical protein FDECE_12493 [Fusarium decemcellulare]|nr:hypothetical protein FDECE_12493 [Fusarium decemcellulare]
MAQFITVEEHFLSDNLPGGLITLPRPPAVPAGTEERLRDTGKIRLQSMDENNIKFSVLSHLVADAKPSDCPSINDDLYTRVSQYPSRFAAFAILSMHDPESAAVELERCVRDLGFVGALIIPTHLPDGTYYDTPRFHPVFETAQKLDVPVYFHPTFPNPEVKKVLYDGPYPPDVAMALSGWCAGFHYESGMHILRLFAAGLFDQFPHLKILIGHAGELLPYTLERNWQYSSRWSVASLRKRDLRQVWDNNIWVSTSATFELSPIACLLRVTKPERILYAVDYPMCSNEEGKKFLEALRESGLVSNAEWDGIAWKNAQDLLRLNV